MDLFVKNTRPTSHFAMVPINLIEDPTLSADAKLVLIYICSKPDEYLIRVASIKQHLSIGDFRWRRISQELRQRRALIHRTALIDGETQMCGTAIEATWEPWLNAKTPTSPKKRTQQEQESPDTLVSRGVGKHTPTRGKPTCERVETNVLNKRERYTRVGARAREQKIDKTLADESYLLWKKWEGENQGASYGQFLDWKREQEKAHNHQAMQMQQKDG